MGEHTWKCSGLLPDGVSSLVYSLNNGPEFPLTIGPDDRRLADPGDFNVEINYFSLTEGENQLVIKAVDTLNNSSEETVTINFTSANEWPATYSIRLGIDIKYPGCSSDRGRDMVILMDKFGPIKSIMIALLRSVK